MKCKFLLCIGMALTLCGCSQDQSSLPSEGTGIVSEKYPEGTFDMDAVRSGIIIKGYPFTVPQKLTDLADGLRYEFVDEEFDDALYEVHISDRNGLVLKTLVRNAHNKNPKAELYNVAVEGSDSSVVGITPLVSSEADVRKQFGEPTEIKMPEESYLPKVYKYGILPTSDGYQKPGQFMTVTFDDSDIVKAIVVNYIK